MNVFEMISDALTKIGAWVFSWFGTDPRVEEVRQRVAQSCGFLPTVSSVAAMFAASNPTVTGVMGIASAICQTVTRNSMRLVSIGHGTVNGVQIEGEWVNK